MQIQTTTKTIENQTSFGANFQITTYEMTLTAFCDCCPNQATGTKSELIRRGWSFVTGAEFCSLCD